MISRYSATLNGISLHSLSPAILIANISYDPPSYSLDSYEVAKRQGAIIQRKHKSRAGCIITFFIREYDTGKRQQVCQQVCRWARNGGILKTGDRPGQMLRCICEGLPSVSSVRDWTEPLQIAFAAYALPYWQEQIQNSITLSSGTGDLFVTGSAPSANVEVMVTASGTVSTITLTCADTSIILSGLGLGSGDKVTITYDDNMIQSIRKNDQSILNKRTGNDDLVAVCGLKNLVGFTADGPCTVKFSSRGLWE